MAQKIQKISEARKETLIVEVGSLDTNTRLYVRDNQNAKSWGEWTITTHEEHDHMISKIDNNKNKVQELGAVYLDMIS